MSEKSISEVGFYFWALLTVENPFGTWWIWAKNQLFQFRGGGNNFRVVLHFPSCSAAGVALKYVDCPQGLSCCSGLQFLKTRFWKVRELSKRRNSNQVLPTVLVTMRFGFSEFSKCVVWETWQSHHTAPELAKTVCSLLSRVLQLRLSSRCWCCVHCDSRNVSLNRKLFDWVTN